MEFRIGDVVKARVPKGKCARIRVGRIAIRNRPSLGLSGFDVQPKYLVLAQMAEGYEYEYRKPALRKEARPAFLPGMSSGAPCRKILWTEHVLSEKWSPF